MTGRKKTPDVLGAVLGEKPKPKVMKASLTSGKATRKSSKTVRHNAIIPENIEKAKATFYLSQPALEDLEGAWYRLRKLARNNRSKVSKSLIVELAIRTALEDLEERGEQSSLAQEMEKH